MTLDPATTVDSGRYTCCGVEKAGGAPVCEHANLEISFELDYDYADPYTDYTVDTSSTANLCHEYPKEQGGICAKYLRHTTVHITSQEDIAKIERQVEDILKQMEISEKCEKKAPQALCHFLMPTCLPEGKKELCRSDCELLRYSSCEDEFKRLKAHKILYIYESQFKCQNLPDVSSNEECTSIGLPSVLKRSDTCYRETGIGEKSLFSQVVYLPLADSMSMNKHFKDIVVVPT